MKKETINFLDINGKLSDFPFEIPDDVLLKSYEAMMTVRYVDERMRILQRQGAISFALGCSGEEACAVGSAAALDSDDWMYPQYREAGVMFYRGFSIEDFVHQMFGDGKDLLLGRMMPNHFGSKKLHVVPVSSPIGTKIPHAAGAAYALKYQKKEQIVIVYFGDGATSEGDFHAGVNFAAVKKVPCIFFCRNNGWAISTPISEQFASDGIYPKAEGYGIEGMRIDGNDFFAVYYAVKEAKKKCLEGKGPILIEAITYRIGAHSTSDDPSVYRKECDVDEWNPKDPIFRLRKYLESKNLWNEAKQKDLEDRLKIQTDEAIDAAKKTPPPPIESLIQDVYKETSSALIDELEEIKPLFEKEP